MAVTIVDTGPIIAAISERDPHHKWAKEQFETLPKPFITCESVLTEATFLLNRLKRSPKPIYDLIHGGHMRALCMFRDYSQELEQLQETYKDRPMSLADACLVRISELYAETQILTMDSDFNVYRKHRNQVIDVIMPE